MRELIEAAIAAGKLPGAVVAFGGAQGLESLQAFGARALMPAHEPMDVDTVFDLASLTKPFLTATAVMQLAEQGRVDLEAPAHRYLPELRRPGARDIRVRDLLLHMAGLPKVTPKRDFEAAHAVSIRRLLATPLEHPPGRRFGYGDTAFLILGALVERVSGESLATYGARHIADPLDLRDTFFGHVPASHRAKTAPTELRDDEWIRGDTHDPRAFRLGGVAGNAGVFTTAQDLARFARALLRSGELDGRRILAPESVRRMTRPRAAGVAVRAYGWDVLSDYSKLRGERLGARAYGHGGFTGTSLWVDPDRDLFVIFLSHRVHPDGTGYVLDLIGQVTDAVVAARSRPVRPPGARATTLGIDRLRAGNTSITGNAGEARVRIAGIVNRASRTRGNERTLDVLNGMQNLSLLKVFTPEHGLAATAEGHVAHDTDEPTGLPLVSLFGRNRRPTKAMLAGIDSLVFDLQDVGARFFTYMSTLDQLLESASHNDVALVVLDRPNPLGADVVEGPVLDRGVRTFVNYHALPVRHGMTAGELAQLLNDARKRPARLSVVWMTDYCRGLPWEGTGLRWVAPSPNLPNLESVRIYPAVALLEGANVSVGRGTAAPFQVVGAPWLDPARWLAALAPGTDDGMRLTPETFTPTSGPFRGQAIAGIHIAMGNTVPRVDLGLWLAATLKATHPDRFELSKVNRMLGHADTQRQLEQARQPRRPTASHILGLADFDELRARYLHYPDCQ